ncbi:unnamed protein product [Thelazia callipaeda]|uniref:Mediator of RNA polymerase II transcription subunit 21 n=1 Tax=Thelazia callipaeda TaxID=103827 RepID=A0A0N5CQI2_THECL|nr:unnamed protein product [Thelazia callipaeda]
MSDGTLIKAGLYVDAQNKVRILQSDAADISSELLDEVVEILDKLDSFISATEAITQSFDQLALGVEKEKVSAIASSNALKAIERQCSIDEQQLKILIRERELELERLRVELEIVQQQEYTLKEYLQNFASS